MMPPGSYYPDASDHELTGGLPINLDSLRDGPPGSKPFYPYSTLIRYAIKGSPTGKLLLEDIYYAIESRFPYFRTAPPGWKNSVRHNLSLNPCFEKVARPLTDRGKGSYWTVNDNVDPRTGVHRIRKKKTKKSERHISEEQPQQQQPPNGTMPEFQPPPNAPFDDPHGQFVQQPPMGPEGAGPSRPGPFPPPYPPFDPAFAMMPPPGLHYPPPPPGLMRTEDSFELDEHGNVDWHRTWVKELQHLQTVTSEQEKAGAEQDWYRMMLFRVRTALMAPPYPGEGMPGPPPPGMDPNANGMQEESPEQQ
ncbi:hypothetical protein GLOTRDRAFT_55344 [Gloeophyllum trabeum ATCC 11539]|uniref:Fork-head domain-containing protein n=1 Tax=Gloeophyllum trabeum (strain ATCC 11539 / FP-39264 / Madison 617) TaxID=670483 RepID=S7QJ41_GLOTA|nr:uncharacterized protein GLOTRDRAFT_55344 [Gloeophyllum trabeum ATCC 11539]EPQ59392.1 hypothetical protein GLOTRDRAFT_55344 [Gloeophyllum trabeum ATCC 11539]